MVEENDLGEDNLRQVNAHLADLIHRPFKLLLGTLPDVRSAFALMPLQVESHKQRVAAGRKGVGRFDSADSFPPR
jgi:hypothetical protein